MTESTNTKSVRRARDAGFSLIELILTMTLTLVILGLAVTLLAETVARKSREDAQAAALADANMGLGRMSRDIANSGFGLLTNGIVAADSSANAVRVRANLNALLKQTSSNVVTDANEDLVFRLIENGDGSNTLVQTDVANGTSSIIATRVDDTDIDNDGIGDGLVLQYFNEAGSAVAPDAAVRVGITLRITLPQVGVPHSPGFQPAVTRVLTSSVVLYNSRLAYY